METQVHQLPNPQFTQSIATDAFTIKFRLAVTTQSPFWARSTWLMAGEVMEEQPANTHRKSRKKDPRKPNNKAPRARREIHKSYPRSSSIVHNIVRW